MTTKLHFVIGGTLEWIKSLENDPIVKSNKKIGPRKSSVTITG
jgi:hypothetical protein